MTIKGLKEQVLETIEDIRASWILVYVDLIHGVSFTLTATRV